jgi:Ankyrin repeats (many copies)
MNVLCVSSRHTKRLLLRAAAFGELIVIESLVKVIGETDKPWRFQECDDQGNTALHLAAKRGHLQMMERLLELDFDPRARNKEGNTPFHEFMLSESDAEVEELVHLIHQDVDFNINEVNSETKETALHMCARLGDWRHFEQLIKAKADLGIQNSQGNTALHVMVEESIRDPGKSCNFIQVCLFVCLFKWSVSENRLDSRPDVFVLSAHCDNYCKPISQQHEQFNLLL